MSSNSPRPTESGDPFEIKKPVLLREPLRGLQQLSIPALTGQLALERGI